MANKITREKIEKSVKKELVSANNEEVVCIDGRVNAEQSRGAVRVPGGDFGIIMPFAATLEDMGIHLSPEEIIDRYSRAKKQEIGQDAKFNYHCDLQNHEAGKIGCAHIAKASDRQYDGHYGSINHQDVRGLFDAFTKHPDSRLTVLEGDHQEKAVLLVHGHPEDEEVVYSINSRNRKGEMYFVADIDRAIKLIKRLTPQFSLGLDVPINADDVILNYLKQLRATVDIVASHLDQHKVLVSSRGYESMNQLPKSRPQQPSQ